MQFIGYIYIFLSTQCINVYILSPEKIVFLKLLSEMGEIQQKSTAVHWLVVAI